MPSDLQVTNIRDQANANSAITIASDGQITVNQNNPTLTLGSNATFPSKSIIRASCNKSVTFHKITTAYNGSPTNYVTVISSDTIEVAEAGSSIYVIGSLHITFLAGTSYYVRLTETTTGLSQILTDYGAVESDTSATVYHHYEHVHGQSAGTNLTYNFQLALRVSNSNGVRLNDYYAAGNGHSYVTTLEVKP